MRVEEVGDRAKGSRVEPAGLQGGNRSEGVRRQERPHNGAEPHDRVPSESRGMIGCTRRRLSGVADPCKEAADRVVVNRPVVKTWKEARISDRPSVGSLEGHVARIDHANEVLLQRPFKVVKYRARRSDWPAPLGRNGSARGLGLQNCQRLVKGSHPTRGPKGGEVFKATRVHV